MLGVQWGLCSGQYSALAGFRAACTRTFRASVEHPKRSTAHQVQATPSALRLRFGPDIPKS